MTKAILPKAYSPFETLHFVSNVLENVRLPLLLRNRPVLLVGTGDEFPRIWLSVPNPSDPNQWVEVVADNTVVTEVMPEANLTPIKVVKSLKPVPTVEVWIANLPILRVRKEDPLVARVDFLELRPLGINVSGSDGGLSIGATLLRHNRVKNAEAFVSAG